MIETERLLIRRFTLDDAEFAHELVNQPSFLEFIGDRGVRTLDDARTYLTDGPLASYQRHGFGLSAVVRKADGAVMGMCGLLKRETLDDPDIGYAFLPTYWGEGFAIEAATAVMADGRHHHGLGRIAAIVSPGNAASIRLLEKLGMRFDRTATLDPDKPAVSIYVSDA